MGRFRFIDLFAGIGGFHQAMSRVGGECVFASEWDRHAAETYTNNYDLPPAGDITQIQAQDIPQHDVLCAGFPCQAFSIAGRQRGFEDTRGTLFFDIARIAEYHRPKVLFLENVKNLVRHEGGRTLATILDTLQGLGYRVAYKVLNSSHFGLLQNRERIYIVAIRAEAMQGEFNFPIGDNRPISLWDILEDKPQDAKIVERPDIRIYKEVNPQCDFTPNTSPPNNPIQIGIVNKGGQGERIYSPYGHAITLSAYGGGVGAKTGLYLVDDVVRKLSPRECARLQGFPEDFRIHPRPSQAYKQFGNSVSINVLEAIARVFVPQVIAQS